ncbi:MAG: hypothetical protein KA354_06405 [Phycisphaerae bacterium]|nr:hypothetical protein [Phycisphaerae bacterium]
MEDRQAAKRSTVCAAPVDAAFERRSLPSIVVLVMGLAASVLDAAPPTRTPYQAVDLNPARLTESWASGVCGGQQVGYGCYGLASSYSVSAMLWTGSADTAVDLNPAGFTWSGAEDTDGVQQAGWGRVYYMIGGRYPYVAPYLVNYVHAMLWTGSAASAVDLHPAGFAESWAYAIGGGQQVGEGRIYHYTPKKGGSYVTQSHALLWTGTAASAVDLHPVGFTFSLAWGVGGGQQVGYGFVQHNTNKKGGSSVAQCHALLWTGSAASVVDLNPAGFTASAAHGVGGGQQVGYGTRTDGTQHALLWTGSAASVVDLHPAGFTSSLAFGVCGGQQVGYGFDADGTQHALLWAGNAAGVVDLNTFLPAGFTNAVATGIDAAGNIVGYAWSSVNREDNHAFLWKAEEQQNN